LHEKSSDFAKKHEKSFRQNKKTIDGIGQNFFRSVFYNIAMQKTLEVSA